MTYITKQQFSGLVSESGADPKEMAKSLLQRGHILEGLNDQGKEGRLNANRQLIDEVNKNQVAQPEKPGLLSKIGGAIKKGTDAFGDLNKGFLKRAGQTAYNFGGTLENISAKLAGQDKTLSENIAGQKLEEEPKFLEPKNTIQKIGGAVETATEFLAPIGAEAKAAVEIAKVAKIAKISYKPIQSALRSTIKGLTSASSAGLVSGVRGENTSTAAKAGFVAPVALDVLGGAGKVGLGVAKFMSSKLSNVPKEAIDYAFTNPQAVQSGIQNAIKHGDLAPKKIYDRAKSALTDLVKIRKEAYQKQLTKLGAESFTNKNGTLYIKKFDKELNKDLFVPTKLTNTGVKQVLGSTLKDFNVRVNDGIIDVSQAAIKDTYAKPLQDLRNTIYKWEDFSPVGIERLKQKINSHRLSELGASASKKKFNAIVDKMYDNVKTYVHDRVPQLKTADSEYSQYTKTIENVLKDFNLLKDKSEATVTRRLMNIFNPKSDIYKEALKKLGPEAVDGIMSDVAGTLMSKWTPEGLGAYMAAGLSVSGAANAVKALVGGSPRLIGTTATTLGKLKQSKIPSTVGNIVKKGLIGNISNK